MSIRLAVPDLSCGHCAATVKQALKDLPGLTRCEVNLATKQVDLDLPEAQLPEALRRLEDEGYPATREA